jgi:hypothetical protein
MTIHHSAAIESLHVSADLKIDVLPASTSQRTHTRQTDDTWWGIWYLSRPINVLCSLFKEKSLPPSCQVHDYPLVNDILAYNPLSSPLHEMPAIRKKDKKTSDLKYP